MPVSRRRFLVALAGSGVAHAALASPREPAGATLLTVTGRVARPGGMRLTEADLLRLPQHSLTTHSPWTSGPVTYSGPLLRDVLAHVGARGTTLRARALNDYEISIPVEDAREHDVIVALAIEGRAIAVRDRGPLLVIYPFSDNPRLQATRYYQRSIWQLAALRVE